MNLPNKLTLARALMIPVFVALFLAEGLPGHYALALLVFAAASFTDLLDGRIARGRGIVTYFGKMIDPLADKMLVMSAMVCFLAAEMAHPAVVIVILAREFLVTSIRLVAMGEGIAIGADAWGKAKTAAQMIWICCGLALLAVEDMFPVLLPYYVHTFYAALIVIVLALTVVSGFNYVWSNRGLFSDM